MNATLTTVPQADGLTMSSRDIAELVESNHADVRRSIERLAERGVISLPPLAEVKTQRQRRAETIMVYNLCKRDSYIVVAQLCPEFTARLVDRWQVLETQVAAAAATPVPALPNFCDPAIAARAWADQYDARNQAETALKLAAPKVEFFDRYADTTGLKGFREVAKLLKANETRFREFLLDHGIMYRLGGALTAKQPHIDAKRFDVKTWVCEDTGRTYNRTMFTSKGVEWIAGEWAVHNLRQETGVLGVTRSNVAGRKAA